MSQFTIEAVRTDVDKIYPLFSKEIKSIQFELDDGTQCEAVHLPDWNLILINFYAPKLELPYPTNEITIAAIVEITPDQVSVHIIQPKIGESYKTKALVWLAKQIRKNPTDQK